MAAMLWVRLMRKTRIMDHTSVPCGPDTFLDALDTACRALDVPRPLVLPRHERDWEEFRQARFLPEHFLEDVPFDRMEAEYIEPDKKKTVNLEYL